MVTKDVYPIYVDGNTVIGGTTPIYSSHIISGADHVGYSNHSFPAPPGGALWDRGGPYSSYHKNYHDDGKTVSLERTGPTCRCIGRIFPITTNASEGSSRYPVYFPETSTNDMNAWGTYAISMVLPTNPAASAAQFIGELREGTPRRVGLSTFRSRALTCLDESRRLRAAGVLGDEYLNVMFGWKPLLSDMRKFYEANKKAEQILTNLENGSGQLTRRRFDLIPATESSSSTVLSTGSYPVPTGLTQLYGVPAIRKQTTKTSTRRWFSGAFTYHVSIQRHGLFGGLDKMKFVYGFNITPEILWELTPWSWLADWETNMGTVLHNLSAFAQDGLVMRWGYAMEEKISSVTYDLSGGRFFNGESTDCTQTFETIRRQRWNATPYGFGLNPDGFTARQWSILAALGISRAPKTLH